MDITVCKFGGSSVGSFAKIEDVARRISSMKGEGKGVVAVVSAMGDTTDDLIANAKGLDKKASERELDFLMATGEVQSAAYMAMALNAMGCKAVSMTCYQAGIMCEGSHGHAKLTSIYPKRIIDALNDGYIVVVAGFQGVLPDGDIATLGRGGSDTTAIAIAAAVGASECVIYTDVDGIYTMDPRAVKDAAKLESITYDEMLELASLGAQVMQPRAVECAMRNGVDFYVKNSHNDHDGTLVTSGATLENRNVVTGVSQDFNVAKMAVFDVPDRPGSAKGLFKALAEAEINIDMIIQSAVRGKSNDIAFTVPKDELDKAVPVVARLVDELGASGMTFGKDVAKVSVVGAGIKSNFGVAADAFSALSDVGVNIEMISTSEVRISCIIKKGDTERAVEALHKRFGLSSKG